jgi:hypothetical protein
MKVNIAVDGAKALKKMARDIERYPAQSARAGLAAVNDVASTVITAASRDISQRYNLPASYVHEKFILRPAGGSNQTAVIAARKRGTRLARFESQQMTAAAKRAKGDTSRNITKGRKQAGISIKVKRQGARQTLKHAFFLPLRAGKVDGGNGMGIFTHEGSRLKHHYGISPSQAYAGWIREHHPNISAALAKAYTARLRAEILRGKK